MRKIAAAALALPVLVLMYFSRLLGRTPAPEQPVRPIEDRRRQARRVSAPRVSIPRRFFAGRRGGIELGAVGVAIVLVVAVLLVGLPVKTAEGTTPGTFAPLAPQANPLRDNADLSLDSPFQLQFTKPMNEGSVQSAIKLTPTVDTTLRWDATDQTLSLLPSSHWQANTTYVLDVSTDAMDQEGLNLSAAIHNSFQTGDVTAGQIVATDVLNNLVAPTTSFQITFTRPVRLATVQARFTISPTVQVAVSGDDPTDLASTVFTVTPKTGLDSDADYTAGFTDGGNDSAGADLKHVDPISFHTMVGPEVVRFRPQDGTRSLDPHQPVSVRFSVAMDPAATAAAFSVSVGGKAISGSKSWAEGNTVLILTPRYSFKVGSSVVASVTTGARSAGGIHLDQVATATFSVAKPTSTGVGGGGVATRTSPWYPSEVYYFNLMNCTRTGRWVNNSGQCSTITRHTLPSQGALRLSAAISNKVSRPYAKYMAERRILDHYAYHNPSWRLCHWGGLCGPSWGENIASPTSSGRGGMVSIELFYQNESWCRCEHYYNIMDPYFHQAGVGVWVANGVVRVSIDFYG